MLMMLLSRKFIKYSMFLSILACLINDIRLNKIEETLILPVEKKEHDYDHNKVVKESKEQRNISEEIKRCQRYGLSYYDENKLSPKRRIFAGSLIADDSWNPIEATATEGYDMYHTVSLVESDSSTSAHGSPRTIRFVPGSTNLKRLTNGTLYGPKTKVHVDYWTRPEKISGYDPHGFVPECMQRDMIIKRWKMNGMKPDDVGIMQDVDETLTRDFLIAIQTCNIKEFRPGEQNCKSPKIHGSTIVFESSPSCVWKKRRWHHPIMMIGECIESIGDNSKHPTIKRGAMNGTSGGRLRGHGLEDGVYDEKIYPKSNTTMYPLWNAYDYWLTAGGRQIQNMHDNSHTGFHFHNFFDDIKTLRNKYLTYSHPDGGALEKKLDMLHEDIKMAADCVLEIKINDKGKEQQEYLNGGLNDIKGDKPIYFTEPLTRQRHEQFRQMIINETELEEKRMD